MVEAMIEWGRTLEPFSANEISRAIDAMKREYLKFPPSLPQFLNLAKAQRCTLTQPPSLPPPRMSREELRQEAAMAVEIMRKILSGQAPPPPRSDKEAYMKWSNHHRRILKMPVITHVNDDGTYEVNRS